MPGIDVALGPVERDPVALLEHPLADMELPPSQVHVHGGAADDAALAPAAGDERRVAGHPAAGGQNRLGGAHALDVLRVRLLANQDDLLALLVPHDGLRRGEDDLARSAARTGGQALGQDLLLLLDCRVDDRMEKLVQLGGRHAGDRLLLLDELLFDHIDGHAHRGRTVALAHATLQHEQPALLDRELDVLHVVVVLLQLPLDAVELPINLRHPLLQGQQVLVVLALGVLVDRGRRADTRDDVLALGVGQVFPVKAVLTVAGVAREGDAGGGVIAHVPEHHGLHVDGGAPLVGDALDASVADGPLAVPGGEDRVDAAPELLVGVVRELLAQDLADFGFERLAENLEVVRRHIGIQRVAPLLLHLVHDPFELPADALILLRLDTACLLHHDVGIHHEQPSIGVIDEPFVAAALPDQARDGPAGQADVQDRLHHAGHRLAGARTHGDQQRVGRIPELLAHHLLDLLHGLRDLLLDACRVLPLVLIEVDADIGRNRETGRHGHAQSGHLRQVRPFAPEQILHPRVALTLAASEKVHHFLCHSHILLCLYRPERTHWVGPTDKRRAVYTPRLAPVNGPSRIGHKSSIPAPPQAQTDSHRSTKSAKTSVAPASCDLRGLAAPRENQVLILQ